MKTFATLITLAAAISTASAYTCPSPSDVNKACRTLDVYPLFCYNPRLNVEACNEKQCFQEYIDNYAACQCRRDSKHFHENAVNVRGLITRCGSDSELVNPYGNPDQYDTDYEFNPTTRSRNSGGATSTNSKGGSRTTATDTTATTTFTSTYATGVIQPGTRIFDGTTYYGGQTAVISGTTRIVSATAVVRGTTILPGTTTWVSGTPGIIRGTTSGVKTSTASGGRTTATGRTTAQPIVGPNPTEIPISAQSHHISKGAIAGIVLGLLGAALLAALLALCWRRKRSAHVAAVGSAAPVAGQGPTRVSVTERIEPVVVKTTDKVAMGPPGTTTTVTEKMVPVVVKPGQPEV